MYSFKCQFNWLVWCWYPIFEEHIFEIKIFLQNSARKLCRIYALLNIRKLFNINCLLGILPFIALSYMNLHIFLQIRQSRQVIILKYYLLNYRRHLHLQTFFIRLFSSEKVILPRLYWTTGSFSFVSNAFLILTHAAIPLYCLCLMDFWR